MLPNGTRPLEDAPVQGFGVEGKVHRQLTLVKLPDSFHSLGSCVRCWNFQSSTTQAGSIRPRTATFMVSIQMEQHIYNILVGDASILRSTALIVYSPPSPGTRFRQ